MGIKYPFGLTKDKIMQNYKELEGGFYPLGENNMWHGGIHIKGFDGHNLHEVTPIHEGEIVACRISEKYKLKNFNDIINRDTLEKIKTINKALDDDNKILSEEEVVSRDFINEFTNKTGFDLLESSISEGANAYFFETTGYDINVLAKVLGLEYSNDFVLIRHKAMTPGGNDIVFFSLYMHLKPFGAITRDIEKQAFYRLFYSDKEYKTDKEEIINAVKLHIKPNLSSPKLLPNMSKVKTVNNILFDNESDYMFTDKDNKRFLKVESLYTNDVGYIHEDLCLSKFDKIEYTASSDIDLYRLGSLEPMGKIKAEAKFQIHNNKEINYYEMDNTTGENFTIKKCKDKYLHVLINSEQSGDSESIELEKFDKNNLYVRYNNYGDIFMMYQGGSTIGYKGKLKIKKSLTLFTKTSSGDTKYISMLDSNDKNIMLYEGDIVDAGNGYDSEGGYFFRKVTLVDCRATYIVGAIKADKSSIVTPELTYTVSDADKQKQDTDQVINQRLKDIIKLPVYDSKKREYKTVIENGSDLIYNGEFIVKDDKTMFKIKSAMNGLTAYVEEKYCKKPDEPILYKATSDIRLYEPGARQPLAMIKEGSLFRIPEYKREYYKGNNDSVPTFYYNISIDKTFNETTQLEFSNTMDSTVTYDSNNLYIRHSTAVSYKKVLKWISDDIYTVTVDCQVYIKNNTGNTFSPRNLIFLEKDQKVVVKGRRITEGDFHYLMIITEKDDQLLSLKRIISDDGIISGSIKQDSGTFELTQPSHFILNYNEPVEEKEGLETFGRKAGVVKSDYKDVYDKKGTPVLESSDPKSDLIDIIPTGTEISFGKNEEYFLTKPTGYQKIEPKNENDFKVGYIYVAEADMIQGNEYISANSEPLPLKIKHSLNDSITNGGISVFDPPIMVKNTTLLGYSGSFLGQENILHLEVFSNNKDFTIASNSDPKEEKFLYKIPVDSEYMFTSMKDKAKKVSTDIPGFSLFEVIPPNDKNKKYLNTKEVKLVAGPAESVWLEINDASKKYIDDKFKIKKDVDFSKLTLYKRCPRFKQTVSKPNSETRTVDPEDTVKFMSTSKNKHGDLSPCLLSAQYGDYRQIKVTKQDKTSFEGWFLRDNFETFQSYTYKILKTNDIEFFDECPLLEYTMTNSDQIEEITEKGDFILPKDYVIEVVKEDDTTHPPTNERSPDHIYHLVKIHKKNSDIIEVDKGFIDINNSDYPISKRGEKYLTIKNTVTNFYDSPPEVKIFSDPLEKNTEEIPFECWADEIHGDTDSIYYKIELEKEGIIYLSKENFDNNIIKKNYFNWEDFEFHAIDDKNEDGIFQLNEVLVNSNDKYANSLKIGDTSSIIRSLKGKENDDFNKAICKHPSEWGLKPDSYFQTLVDDPLIRMDATKKSEEKDLNENLGWWDDGIVKKIEGLPSPDDVFYFHPIDFLEHLEHITSANVRDILIKAVGTNVAHYKGMNISFIMGSLEESLIGIDSEHAANVEYALRNIFNFCGDPEIQALIGTSVKISSTYWTTTTDPGHIRGHAIDLTGANVFYYTNSEGVKNNSFDPEVAIKVFDILAKKYGVKQILFNCPRVIQNCKTAYVNGKYISHHHHAHVCFNYQYKRYRKDEDTNEMIYSNSYHCKHGNYKCPRYDGCEWNKDKYTIDYNKNKCVQRNG